MISATTVSYGHYPDEHIENLIKSIQDTTSQIKELVAIYGKNEPFYKEEKTGSLTIKHVAPEFENIKHIPKGSRRIFSFEKSKYEDHGFAMHEAIKYSAQKYVMMTDPDVVFFWGGFDEMYLRLYQKYNLNIIGISHYENKGPFGKTFPTIINCLVEKNKLPSEDFLKGRIKIRPYLSAAQIKNDDWPVANGAYLYPAVIMDRYKEFPNPNAFFQTGDNLYLWDKDNGRRHVTFISSENGSDYFLNCTQSSLKEFNEQLPNKLLLKHVQGWQKDKKESIEICKEWYVESKKLHI